MRRAPAGARAKERPHREAGFTLIEVLAAMVVLGLILAGLAGGVQFGQRAAGTQAARIAASDSVATADRVLRRLIAAMDPGSAADPPQITGERAALAFTVDLAQSQPGFADPGPMAAGLGVDADHRLVLRWTPALYAIRLGPAPAPRMAVLLDGVAGVDFSYWSGREWLPEWQGDRPPPLVRIHLRFVPHTRDPWPGIIAATERLRPAG